MTAITAPTPQPAPMSPPARRRLLWATLAFTLGAISGAGITLAVDDDTSSGADVGAVVSDVERHPTAGVAGTPFGSADALERAAQHRLQTKAANCTRLPTSADASERCLSISAVNTAIADVFSGEKGIIVGQGDVGGPVVAFDQG